LRSKFVITLEGNEDYLIVKPAKQLILEMIPKGKTTTATLVAKAVNIHTRRALHYLKELEEAGHLTSELGVIQKNDSGNRVPTRIFKRL